MKIKKLIYIAIFTIIIMLFGRNLGKMYTTSYNNETNCSNASNEIINNQVQEIKENSSIKTGNSVEENQIVEDIEELKNNKAIPEDNAVEKNVEKKTVENKDQETAIPVSKSNISTEEHKECTKFENPTVEETVTITVPNKEIIQEPQIQETVQEEYIYNNEMTQRIINIINNNPSEYMIQDGYSVEIDSSIVNLTNQFTFTDERVINKILYKAGTIKVYAQDYYFGGQYLFTECYIM